MCGQRDRRVRADERVPNVDPPFTTQQVDDEVLEDKLRLDESSREEPPQPERVIDSEGHSLAPTSVGDRVNP